MILARSGVTFPGMHWERGDGLLLRWVGAHRGEASRLLCLVGAGGGEEFLVSKLARWPWVAAAGEPGEFLVNKLRGCF